MHIIVVGCGRVGSGLALELEALGHSVTVLDKNENSFKRLSSNFRGNKLVGFGFDKDNLTKAGAESAGGLAAVTSGDNSNILTARIARESFGIENVVARIYDPRRAEIYRKLGIPTVATVSWTTNQVLRKLIPDSKSLEWSNSTAQLKMYEITIDPALVGKSVESIEPLTDFKIVGINRATESFIAKKDTILQEGDVVYAVVRSDSVHILNERFNIKLDLLGEENS
jgi:trk system potassium uptake protein TrkA